jgi:hypothetical protein
MRPYIFNEGNTVYCNNYREVFEIENHGGIYGRSRRNRVRGK